MNLDPKKWTFKVSKEVPEYSFQSKNNEIYGMIINEELDLEIDDLREIAITNGSVASPDLQIIEEEYRMVNDVKVLMITMEGTIQGMKFRYHSYYFSGEGKSVQFVTYGSIKKMKDNISLCDELLNGFVLLK